MTWPSLEMAWAALYWRLNEPVPSIWVPLSGDQRKPKVPLEAFALPTMTEPTSETSDASHGWPALLGASGRRTMPSAAFQRNAADCGVPPSALPTIMEPSGEIPHPCVVPKESLRLWRPVALVHLVA